MNNLIRAKILEIAQSSDKARVLAARLLDMPLPSESSTVAETIESPRETVADLMKHIQELQTLVSELQGSIDDLQHPDAVFTDAEAATFVTSFMSSLKDVSSNQLVSCYSTNYFAPLPKNVRVIMATCLINEFDTRQVEPSSLWQQLVAKNGVI